MRFDLRIFSASTVRVGLGLLALLFVFATQAAAQTRPQPPVPLPTPFTPIVDYANVIDAGTRQRLESIYLNLKDRGGVVYSVLTVQTTGEQDIFDFSLATARGWGIGPKDAETPSFLLVVAVQDRKYFTLVSQHLEGELPDGLVGQIQRERLVPAFKQGNYSKGINDTVQAYIATIASKRGFSIDGIDQRYAYTDRKEPPVQGRQRRLSFTQVCCGIIVLVFILIVISAASRGGGGRGGRGGRRGGFGGGGLLEALLWGSVLGNLSGGGRGWGSSSGWGSSGGFGGGGFGGGGGGGFGGGFGGGDSFGGGGAGGSW
jgi:uncharacterized protein